MPRACCSAKSFLPILRYTSASNCIAINLLALPYILPFVFDLTASISGKFATAKSRSFTIKSFTSLSGARTKSVLGAVSAFLISGTLPYKVAKVL
ncbi:hypothetical protein D3C87_1363310 [compost metagenome]